MLVFMFFKEKMPSLHTTQNSPSRDVVHLRTGESVLLSNARNSCRFETTFVDQFFKIYKVIIRFHMCFSTV